MRRLAALVVLVLVIAGCASSVATTSGTTGTSSTSTTPKARPQAVEPMPGNEGIVVSGTDPVGDVNAHAPALAEVKKLLKQELVAVRANNVGYINPLQYVTVWGRTDQGVDAQMRVGSPILAPCRVKILAIIPDWFAGQPLVYYELLDGPDAGRIQYVSEQITAIAPAGSILLQGQPIARYAATGTAIEFGWSTVNGVTLARATTGYEEGQVTPAGASIRAWLNALGANAGTR